MMLRVSVSGGGCSGFQYGFTFDDARNGDDRVVEKDGVTVLIDEMSWEFLAGGEIDYVEELIGAYFTVRNPNASATCGCGTSFAV
jgi:iron-sulfur cluster insertion protein